MEKINGHLPNSSLSCPHAEWCQILRVEVEMMDLDEEFHELLKGMVELDPEKRLSVQECLASPWFRSASRETSVYTDDGESDNTDQTQTDSIERLNYGADEGPDQGTMRPQGSTALGGSFGKTARNNVSTNGNSQESSSGNKEVTPKPVRLRLRLGPRPSLQQSLAMAAAYDESSDEGNDLDQLEEEEYEETEDDEGRTDDKKDQDYEPEAHQETDDSA